MTIDEIKQTDWYQSRPLVIQQAIDLLPPTQLYRVKSSGKQCQLYSYEEPTSGLLEDVTVTVHMTGVGQLMPLQYGVFGFKLTDLEPWEE